MTIIYNTELFVTSITFLWLKLIIVDILSCGDVMSCYVQSLLIQLAQLCGIAKYHLTPYVKDMFEVVSH